MIKIKNKMGLADKCFFAIVICVALLVLIGVIYI